jgi:hypothetical protein
MTVPREFLALGEPGDEFKFEILVREASGNQRAASGSRKGQIVPAEAVDAARSQG